MFTVVLKALSTQWELLTCETSSPWPTYRAMLFRVVYNRYPLLLMSQLIMVLTLPQTQITQVPATRLMWLLLHPLPLIAIACIIISSPRLFS